MSIERSNLALRMQAGEFLTSIQIDPPNKACFDDLLSDLNFLLDAGINIVDINSSRRVSFDCIQLAGVVKKQFGFEVIPHITTRDTSLNGLANQILASYALAEVRNFLIITGDPHETTSLVSDHVGVFQTDSIGALEAFNKHLRKPPLSLNITLAAAVNQNEADLAAEGRRIWSKILAGADFFMSQTVFNIDQALSAAQFYRKYSSKPLLIGIWPLISHKKIEEIYSGKFPGVVLPKQVYQSSLNLKEDDALKNWGISKALDLIDYIKENRLSEGVYIVSALRKASQLTDLIKNLS